MSSPTTRETVRALLDCYRSAIADAVEAERTIHEARIAELETQVTALTSERDEAKAAATHQRARADAYRAMLEWLRLYGLNIAYPKTDLWIGIEPQHAAEFLANLSTAAGVTLPADSDSTSEQQPATDPQPAWPPATVGECFEWLAGHGFAVANQPQPTVLKPIAITPRARPVAYFGHTGQPATLTDWQTACQWAAQQEAEAAPPAPEPPAPRYSRPVREMTPAQCRAWLSRLLPYGPSYEGGYDGARLRAEAAHVHRYSQARDAILLLPGEGDALAF